MPTQLLEIGFDLVLPTGPFFTLDDATKGQLDNTNFPLAGFQYYDITDYATDIGTQRGKSDFISTVSSGELYVTLDNRNRFFDPLFEASPFFGNIKPKRLVKYTVDGVLVYEGVIDDWNLAYTIDGDAIASFSASDAFVYFNNQTLPAATDTSQSSGARINAILDNAFVDWPAQSRDIDAGSVTLGANPITDNQNVLLYMQQAELAELGFLFISKDGKVVFRQRTDIPPTTGIVRFADDGSGIPYNNMIIGYGSEDLVNEVVANSVITGSEITAKSVESQQEFGIFNATYTDLLLSNNAQVESFALNILARFQQPVYRFKEIQVRLNALSPEDAQSILSLELADYVTVGFTPSGIAPAINKYAQVIRIAHTASLSGEHIVAIGLDTRNLNYLVLDDTIFGRLNEGALA